MIGAVNTLTLDMIYSSLPGLPALGEEVSTGHFHMTLGGGPSAALITAARLGVEARLATYIGNDTLGALVRTFLDQEPIAFHDFGPEDGAALVNVTSVMTFPQKDRSFVSYFAPQRIEETEDSAVCDYLSDSELVIISGSNENVIHHLAANGCKILYDVGWSNDLSLDALIPVLRSVAVFSPNEKEALKMTCTARAEDALKILSRVVRHPIIKLGARGALLWQDGGAVHIPPAPFISVDTTGAGDAFLGGVAYGMSRNWSMPQCVRFGNYTGGKATTAIGCLTARSSLEEYKQLEPQMR